MTVKEKIRTFLSSQKISKPLLIFSTSLFLVSVASFFVLKDYKETFSPSKKVGVASQEAADEGIEDEAISDEKMKEDKDLILTPSPLPTPTIKPIPTGKTGFSVSQSDKSVPLMGRGSIDPYDPNIGGDQVVRIAVRDDQPITSVTGVLKTDNKTASAVSFKLVDGSLVDGAWEGSWKVNDTYETRYNLVLSATSSRGTSSIEITLR